MNEDNNNEQSRKDVSSEWLRFIFQRMIHIAELEVYMRNGCENLLEYMTQMNISYSRISEIRLKNLELLMNDIDMILSDVREILPQKEFETMKSKINAIRHIFHNGIKGNDGNTLFVSNVITSDVRKKQRTTILTSLFDILENDLSGLRAELVKSLSPVLYSLKNNEGEILK